VARPDWNERRLGLIADGDFHTLATEWRRRHGYATRLRPSVTHDQRQFAGLRPSTSTFERITAANAGLLIDHEQFIKTKKARELRHQQSVFLAAALESIGVSAYRKHNPDDVAITLQGGITGAHLTLDGKRMRNLKVLPGMAQKSRNDLAMELQAYIEAVPGGDETRYHVQTLGPRVRVTDDFLVQRRHDAVRFISKELRSLLAMNGVDLILQTRESPVARCLDGADAGFITAHDHFNLALVPLRADVVWSDVERLIVDAFKRARLAGDTELAARHGEHIVAQHKERARNNKTVTVYRRHGFMDQSPLRNAKEFAKYITKGDELVAMAHEDREAFAAYVEAERRCKAYAAYGTLKTFRADIKKAKCRVVRDGNNGTPVIPKGEPTSNSGRLAAYDSVNDCRMGDHERSEQEAADEQASRERVRASIKNRHVGTMLPTPMFFNLLEPVLVIQGFDPSLADGDDNDLGVAGWRDIQAQIASNRRTYANRLAEQGVVLAAPEAMQEAYEEGRICFVHTTHHNCPLTVMVGGVPGTADANVFVPPPLKTYSVHRRRAAANENTRQDTPPRRRKRSRGGVRRRMCERSRAQKSVAPIAVTPPQVVPLRNRRTRAEMDTASRRVAWVRERCAAGNPPEFGERMPLSWGT
jgi:hypothetical protein